ncbi:MAG: phytanoyl-CoA dioxygenase family protein [Phycisphaeraceae bacterium]
MVRSHPRALTAEQFADFQRDGYIIVRGLIGPVEAAMIRDAFMDQARDGPVEGLSDTSRLMGGNDPLARYPRMMHPHLHDELPVGELAMRYMLDPRIENVLWDVLGEEPIAAQTMFYFKPPQARGQDLHQDNFYLRIKPGTCMAAWIAIDDVDQENGGMVVVPGSHKLDLACPEKADPSRFFTTEHVEPPEGMRTVPADMKAGDVLFFGGSVIHGSYPNTSKDRFRRALICHYAPVGCTEASKFYKLFDFAGQRVGRAEAVGGGPCGELQEAVSSPH